MNRNKVDTVIFDLWGTLFSGLPDEILTLVLHNLGYDDIKDEDRDKLISQKFASAEEFLAVSLESIEIGFFAKLPADKKSELLEFYNDHLKLDQSSVKWIDGAKELLNKLKGKYKLILVTNLWWYQIGYVEKKIAKYFDEICFSAELGKTKPDMVKYLIASGAVKPESTQLIGDSYDDDIMLAINEGLSARKTLLGGPIDTQDIIRELELDEVGSSVSTNLTSKSLPNSILYITPPYFKLHSSHNNRLNLSITTLAEISASWGIESKVYNADGKDLEVYPSRYHMMVNSIDFYKILESDDVWEGMIEATEKMKPEVVLITCSDIVNASKDSGIWESSLKAARLVRKLNPSAYIIAYGPSVGQDVGDFDLVVGGELEEIFRHILEDKPKGRASGGLTTAATLSGINIFKPEERLLSYFSKRSYDTLFLRRGCEGTCSFCQVATINAGRVSFKPFDNVLKDMKMRKEKYGINDFYFTDANFCGYQDIVTRFCNQLHDEMPDVTWKIESRFDNLNDDMLATLKKTGCSTVKLGLENPLGDGYQTNTKKIRYSEAKDWVARLSDAGIKPILYILLGGSWITEKDYDLMFEKTAAMNAAGYVVSLHAPYPGTHSGLSVEEWKKWNLTGSHLDIRLMDYWKVPKRVIDDFFRLEESVGRDAHDKREFVNKVKN